MLRDHLERLIQRQDLSPEEMAEVMGIVMDGKAPPMQVAGLLMALRSKGETVGEVVGAARAMRARVLRPPLALAPLLDTCGTGGDGSGSINISTAAALIAASAGVTVAKHGNRSISSKSGSADLLDALKIPTDLGPDEAAKAIETHGFAFLFAPLYHPAMKAVMPVRRELVVRTVFNILGPLTNPAGARTQLVGVPNSGLAEKMALALRDLGLERGMVVSSRSGMDEISPDGETMAYELRDGKISQRIISAADFGLAPAPAESVRGGDPAQNAAIIRAVLGGDLHPARTAIVINTGAALYVAGLVNTLEEGARLAERTIASGAVTAKLKALAA